MADGITQRLWPPAAHAVLSWFEMPRHLPQVPAPPYAFVPGRWPHPRRHPDGHSYRQPAPPVVRLSEQRWGDNAAGPTAK